MEKIIFNYTTKEPCMFNQNIIGSMQCLHCDYLAGFDSEENWVKCQFYNMATENKLIDKNKSFIENQNKILNFMLKSNKIIINKGAL